MAKVAVATRAADFYPDHAVAGVTQLTDVGVVKGFVEAGPTGAGLELAGGVEQRQVAELAVVDAVFLVIQQAATEGGLGALVKQDAALFFAQVSGVLLLFRIAQRGQVLAAGGRGHQASPLSLSGKAWNSFSTLGMATARI